MWLSRSGVDVEKLPWASTLLHSGFFLVSLLGPHTKYIIMSIGTFIAVSVTVQLVLGFVWYGWHLLVV